MDHICDWCVDEFNDCFKIFSELCVVMQCIFERVCLTNIHNMLRRMWQDQGVTTYYKNSILIMQFNHSNSNNFQTI